MDGQRCSIRYMSTRPQSLPDKDTHVIDKDTQVSYVLGELSLLRSVRLFVFPLLSRPPPVMVQALCCSPYRLVAMRSCESSSVDDNFRMLTVAVVTRRRHHQTRHKVR